jgi:hypothetical protein
MLRVGEDGEREARSSGADEHGGEDGRRGRLRARRGGGGEEREEEDKEGGGGGERHGLRLLLLGSRILK